MLACGLKEGAKAVSKEAQAGNAGRSGRPERIGTPAAIRGINHHFHLPTSEVTSFYFLRLQAFAVE